MSEQIKNEILSIFSGYESSDKSLFFEEEVLPLLSEENLKTLLEAMSR